MHQTFQFVYEQRLWEFLNHLMFKMISRTKQQEEESIDPISSNIIQYLDRPKQKQHPTCPPALKFDADALCLVFLCPGRM